MLPRQHRLVRTADFTATTRRGARAGDRLLVVHARATPLPVPAVVGFVVSKAVGGSVVRSRTKRRLRHAVAERLDVLAAGDQVVVRAQPALTGADHGELVASLDRCLSRALDRVRRGPGGAPTAQEVIA